MTAPSACEKQTPAGSPPPAVRKEATSRRSPPSVAKLPLKERSAEARRIAAAILEVLAGVRTPTEAAGALGVSLPRYYALEARAVEGCVVACERRGRGPRRRPEREISRLRRETERLEREVARYQALLRASQRAVGLRAVEPQRAKRERGGKKRRKRRPVSRALRAVGVLRFGSEVLEPISPPEDTVGGPKA